MEPPPNRATSTLSGLVPQNAIESNYIDFFTVYIHLKDNTYSVADSILLKTLAEGCPVRDGMSVRKARTLYSAIYKDFSLYSDNCTDNNSNKKQSNESSEKTTTQNLSLEVYPNPNNGTFMISLNSKNTISGLAEVRITDVLGNQISKINLNFQNNIAIFDARLKNGVYFISIKDANSNTYNPKKIIVIE